MREREGVSGREIEIMRENERETERETERERERERGRERERERRSGRGREGEKERARKNREDILIFSSSVLASIDLLRKKDRCGVA